MLREEEPIKRRLRGGHSSKEGAIRGLSIGAAGVAVIGDHSSGTSRLVTTGITGGTEGVCSERVIDGAGVGTGGNGEGGGDWALLRDASASRERANSSARLRINSYLAITKRERWTSG